MRDRGRAKHSAFAEPVERRWLRLALGRGHPVWPDDGRRHARVREQVALTGLGRPTP